MLLTITTTHNPATDLGYLLHKHPDRIQTFALTYGKAHVFYPEVSESRCTVALLLDIDPVGLVRNDRDNLLTQYVNDRPYVASSFLSVALSQVFSTAQAGRCKVKQEVADIPIPLEARISSLPCKGGELLLRKLFEPLGYEVTASQLTLDEKFPEWGESRYYSVALKSTIRLCDLLNHLYVMIPVLDADKHYYFGVDEVDKLLRQGETWLAQHPERNLIVKRYLKDRHNLTRAALERLMEEDKIEVEEVEDANQQQEVVLEEKISLNQQRLEAVITVLKEKQSRRVVDLGCGDGKLIKEMMGDRSFDEILGIDVSYRSLERASRRLKLDQLSDYQKAKIRLIHGSLIYRDKRLDGYDAATVIEVIEHLDPPRLAAFEKCLFEYTRPATIIVTTPNVEYNSLFEGMPEGTMRHKDHRFEWTRAEFKQWGDATASMYGYKVDYASIGPLDNNAGSPTQMAIFKT